MKEPTFTKRLMGVTGGLSQSFLHITVGAGFSDNLFSSNTSLWLAGNLKTFPGQMEYIIRGTCFWTSTGFLFKGNDPWDFLSRVSKALNFPLKPSPVILLKKLIRAACMWSHSFSHHPKLPVNCHYNIQGICVCMNQKGVMAPIWFPSWRRFEPLLYMYGPWMGKTIT